MSSERTLSGDTPLGSVRAEESSQRTHSQTMSVVQEESGKHWRRVQLGSQHVESLQRKYGVSMQIVSYQGERPCSEIEAALVLCRYYFGVQVAVMAAETAVGTVKGKLYWREREWLMVKDRRKRALAAEEMAAAEKGQEARENEAASDKASAGRRSQNFSTVRRRHGIGSTKGEWRLRRELE